MENTVTKTKQRMLMEMLGAKPIAFNPQLARLCGSIKAGLLLSQLLYWLKDGEEDVWIYKTIDEIEKETALTRKEQDSAILRLKQLGFIQVELRGVPAKRHFQLVCTKVTNQFVQKLQTSLYKTDKLTYKDNTTDILLSKDNRRVSSKKPSCPLLSNSLLKEKYPNGHTECVEYLTSEEEDRGQKFINRVKQFVFIHKILRAGYGFDDMDKAIRQIEKKYGKGAWDFATLANWLEKGGAYA